LTQEEKDFVWDNGTVKDWNRLQQYEYGNLDYGEYETEVDLPD
jgi:hypothetical protein